MRLVKRTPELPARNEDELEALLVAARAAVEHPTGVALDRILDAALNLVGADEGSVQLLDPATMTLNLVAARGFGSDTMDRVVAVGQGISGSVAVSGQPLLLSSTVDVDRFVGFTPKTRTIYSALCVPLRTRSEIVGVLSVNIMRPGRAFTERDLRVIGVFAETTALALVNARLLEDATRHARELELLRGATVRLSASLDLQTVADAILREGLTIAGTDLGFVCIARDPARPLELARFTGLAKDRLRALLSSPAFRHIGSLADIRIVEDATVDPVISAIAGDLGDRALAILPMRTADGTADGILGLALPRDSGPEAKRLLMTYAVQAGFALSNAILYRTVETRERELETIVSTLELPIILIDDEGCYRSINPAAAHLFGLVPDFELGRPVRGSLSPELEEIALDTSGDVSVEACVEVGGEERTYRVIAAGAATGRAGGGRILLLLDLSSQRDLERKKADFVAVIGHELRTPLTSIKGYAHTLVNRRRALPPETQEQSVRAIIAQSERLERLIEDLLYVSRVENNRPPVRLAWDDVVAVTATVAGDAQRRNEGRRIDVFGPPDLPILTDRIKVEQIVAHLIDNALKYSPDRHPVTVTVQANDDVVSIAVGDRGPGIYSGDVARIFEPFTQLDSSSTRQHGGTGLGLYVCRTLSEILGGRIDVETALGKGSTFTLVLPRRAHA